MTIRLPQNLTTQLQTETGASILEMELLAEHAAALGQYGNRVEKVMQAWHARGQLRPAEETAILNATAQAVYAYFVQREAIGLNSHDHPIKHYKIPPEILAQLGAINPDQEKSRP